MRVVVCGSRDFDDAEVMWDVLRGLLQDAWAWPSDGQIDWEPKEKNLVIIDGASDKGGADDLAHDWAVRQIDVKSERFPPALRPGWSHPTSDTYLARNRAMIDSGADLCIAFVNKPLEDSRGTAYTVAYARSKGVKTIVVEVR